MSGFNTRSLHGWNIADYMTHNQLGHMHHESQSIDSKHTAYLWGKIKKLIHILPMYNLRISNNGYVASPIISFSSTWLLKPKNVTRCRDSRSAKSRETRYGYNSSIHNISFPCFMLSSLPCFYAFCWSAIPTPHYSNALYPCMLVCVRMHVTC